MTAPSAPTPPDGGRAKRCSANKMHADIPRRSRPVALYMAMANPCHAPSCDGRICITHPICADCAAALRAGKTRWGVTGETAELALLHNAPKEPSR